MKENIIAIENSDYDEKLSIDIYLGNVCNYSCHYCHPGLNEGDKRFPQDYDLFVKNIDHMLDVYKTNFNKKDIKIELSGGEPTLWPRIADLAKHLKQQHNKVVSTKLITNGSRTLRWWKENANFFDEIHISLHPEGTSEHIIQVADHIYNNTDNHVSVNVVLDPTDWEASKAKLDKVIEHPTPWLTKSWLLVLGAYVRQDYTEQQLKEFEDRVKKIPPRNYIDKMIQRKIITPPSQAHLVFNDGKQEPFTKLSLKRNNGDNVFTGWECNVGVDRISCIWGDIIASCGARYLFNLDKPLSLYDAAFIKKFTPDIVKPVICKQPVCGSCTSDLRIPKRKI